MVQALIEHVLPPLTLAEVTAIIEKRFGSQEPKFQTLLCANAEVATEVVDLSERKKVLDEIQKLKKQHLHIGLGIMPKAALFVRDVSLLI